MAGDQEKREERAAVNAASIDREIQQLKLGHWNMLQRQYQSF